MADDPKIAENSTLGGFFWVWWLGGGVLMRRGKATWPARKPSHSTNGSDAESAKNGYGFSAINASVKDPERPKKVVFNEGIDVVT